MTPDPETDIAPTNVLKDLIREIEEVEEEKGKEVSQPAGKDIG